MTTLPTLLAELDSAPNGCLDDVRRQLRVIVVAVMEMREAKAADPLAVDSEIVKLRQLCTSLREERDLLSARLIDSRAAYRRQYDDSERTLAECVRLGVDVNTLRADVARLTAELERTKQTYENLRNAYDEARDQAEKLRAMSAIYRDGHEQAMRERDAAKAAMRVMERLRDECVDELATRTTERDAARDINTQLRREIGDCLTVDMLIKERDAARETVAAEIAAWFERHPEPGQLTRERIAEDIREGRWRKEGA